VTGQCCVCSTAVGLACGGIRALKMARSDCRGDSGQANMFAVKVVDASGTAASSHHLARVTGGDPISMLPCSSPANRVVT